MTTALGKLVGRGTAWLVVVLALLISVGVLALRGEAPEGEPTGGLPASAESSRAAALQDQLPDAATEPALVVVTRDDGGALTAEDLGAVAETTGALADLATGGRTSPPVPSPDGGTALVTVPLEAGPAGNDATAAAVDEMRERLRELPDGLTAYVTGPAGFTTDLGRVFEGADVTLLATTAVVVALLLLVTYRSPVLWIVPLAVVGIGDQVAASLLTILDRTTGIGIGPSTTGIVSILVFGAGTNYALLLIARYREELRHEADRHQAMRRALRSAAPAIVASAGTVVLSLLTLTAADLTSNRNLGIAGALGITTALLFGLVVLPAALVLFDRWLFWPFVPRVGSEDPTRSGLWAKVARGVGRRPALVGTGAVLVLAALATGVVGQNVGLSQTQQFRERPESLVGQEVLAEAFPAGSGEPLAVMTTVERAPAVAEAAAAVAGIASARPGTAAGTAPGDVVQVDAVLEAGPGTEEADATIARLRTALDAADPDAVVGGTTATTYDTALAADRDQRVVAPLVLAVVLVVLVLVLRSLVAAVVLVATVVLSFAAAMGASRWLFDAVFDFPALDVSVPLLAFLFLVALGVDYNIFLTTRAREEAALRPGARGTAEGMAVALAVTGGVITSAGVLLAAVFTVLGVLPLILLTQLGVIVGVGVLLDTLLVRSVLVPALVTLLGPRTWWPSPLARTGARGHHRVSGGGAAPARHDLTSTPKEPTA
ncbi:MMPL family transporter [Kineococcus glutinatus]|uniref:MMPL family transporter n=1 Tax=Kineococcus glutinatus TaxID=1070872 RepID=A0ABP9H5N0_9ACTN